MMIWKEGKKEARNMYLSINVYDIDIDIEVIVIVGANRSTTGDVVANTVFYYLYDI